MPTLPISAHALIGNSRGAALVDRVGCIDWACLPRFDSPSCFTALLGDERHGRWSIAPAGGVRRSTQRYRDGTLVVETEFVCEDGRLRVVDAMPDADGRSEIVRIVQGLEGSVPMRAVCNPRFGYGLHAATWSRLDDGWLGIGEQGRVAHYAPVGMQAQGDSLTAEFRIDAGAEAAFGMSWLAESQHPERIDPQHELRRCEAQWRAWAQRCRYRGPHRAMVQRSLITLKALIHQPTGAIIAAPTASLPEAIGGERNWDYRYCWLRDATFTLYALLGNGYEDEARAWRDWLVNSVDDHPDDIRVLYAVDGAVCTTERIADWLPGYRDSRPVRFGNGAAGQFQLDVRGEVMDLLHTAHENGLDLVQDVWATQCELLDDLERRWHLPDSGIWEIRGEPRHFVHSKAMAWVAFDRAIRTAQGFGLTAPMERWVACREAIRADIYRHGFDRRRGCFVQRYGSDELDASLLLLPLLGFIRPDHPDALRTLDAVQAELKVDGLLRRYHPDPAFDGLQGTEGAFLPCSFWLVDGLALGGRQHEAEALFERLLGHANEVGLLPEEVDPVTGEALGNFPQSLTHVGLVNSARILADLAHWGDPPDEAARPEHRAWLQANGRRLGNTESRDGRFR
jgi:GH15 family glucan-1,4-alpha-glucosidase